MFVLFWFLGIRKSFFFFVALISYSFESLDSLSDDSEEVSEELNTFVFVKAKVLVSSSFSLDDVLLFSLSLEFEDDSSEIIWELIRFDDFFFLVLDFYLVLR